MSTEAGYPDQYAQMAAPSPRMTSKRKRGVTDSPGNMRNSPMTRRSNNGPYATDYSGGDSTGAGAPTASMNEQHASPYLQQNAVGFDLPHLQPNTNRVAEEGEASNVDTAAAALNYSMQVPTHPADNFMAQSGAGEGDQSTYSNVDEGNTSQFQQNDGLDEGEDGSMLKKNPDVGSEEWQRMRKDNHKEVERRRRETINEGINELAKIVPGCEKNKGSILQRAVQYIQKLHEDASQNIDKWTFEKLVTEQAINDLSGKLQRAWAEKEAWKRVAKDAGVDVDAADLGLDDEDGEADEDRNGGGGSADADEDEDDNDADAHVDAGVPSARPSRRGAPIEQTDDGDRATSRRDGAA